MTDQEALRDRQVEDGRVLMQFIEHPAVEKALDAVRAGAIAAFAIAKDADELRRAQARYQNVDELKREIQKQINAGTVVTTERQRAAHRASRA